MESVRSLLQVAISKYVSSAFLSDQAAGGVYTKDGSLSVVVAGEKVNLKNFWSGRWNSVWNIQVSSGSFSIGGDIKVDFIDITLDYFAASCSLF